MNDVDVPNAVKKVIVESEIQMHKNTVYLLGLRHRVNKKLGNLDGVLKQIEDEMAKEEQAVDILSEELRGVNSGSGESDG